MKILIVDDERVSRAKLGAILKDIGECTFAENGSEALRLALAESPPDLILLDVMMDDIDGYEVCRKLKNSPKTEHIPIIFITGRIDQESETRGFHSGANDFITKPFSPEVVKARVNTQLTIKKHRDHLEELVEARTRKLNQAYEDLQASQGQLIHQEKLATIGELAAGVLHEISSPLTYISANNDQLTEYFESIENFINELTKAIHKDAQKDIGNLRQELDIDFILENIPISLEESKHGTSRIMKIAIGLRNFSRKDHEDFILTDINECIDEALNIARNELKHKAEVVKMYGNLEKTLCSPLQLSQVFINLLVNAAHSLDNKGNITITTQQKNSSIIISIADTGCGISEENKQKIFEPFFTTKEAGKGTGLGMSIASDIIKSHKGKLSLESHIGKGTTFTIVLPAVEQ